MRRLLQRKLCRRKTLLFTLFLLSLTIGTTPASAKEVTVTFTMSDYGFKNAQVVTSMNLNDDFSATFTKGGSNDPKYYTSDNTLRIYKGGTAKITTSNSNFTIKSINPYSGTTDSGTPFEIAPNGKSGSYTATATTKFHHFNITYDDGTAPDTRQDVTLAWSESAVSTNIGETFTAPTLTVNPADATSSLVYSSSDTSVAEIATNGTVTIKIKAVGQTTITAAIPDEDATYKPISASYTLTVIDPNEVYYLVKTKGNFDVTQECILVAYNGSYQAAMGAQGDGNYRSAVSYSSIDASLPEVLLAPAGTVPFTLEPTDDPKAYYIKVGENKYISVNKGSNSDTYEYEEEKKSSASTVNLNINGTDHKASLKASGGRALGYNNSANPKRFASYSATSDTYNNVYLYQKRSATPALGDITFDPAPGEVTRGTEVTISCNNATQLYYIFSYEETGNGHFVTGNSTTVTITQDCSIEVIATNASSTQKTILVNYTIKAAPICGDITFDPASGSEVEEGSDVSISCENAVKLTYTITKGDVTSELVEVEGSSTTVSVTEPCTLTVNAVNADNIAATQVSASYTIAPKTTYELVEAYNGNDIPDGNYIFASTTANGSFMMKGQEKDYRIADDVTITENKFGAYPRFEITVKKEDNGYYSLITNDNNYIYATAERKVAETTETAKGQGKWQPEISGSTMQLKWVNGEDNFGSLQMNKSADSERFTTYTSSQAPISLYTVQSTKCGSVIFNPAPGSKVPINSTVKISCKNATQISYSITKNEGPSTTVVVDGSVAEVTITEDCIIEAYGTNDEGDSDIADAIYTVQEPFTLYTDFYEETGAPYIPDGNYVLVGSVSTGESAGEYYMAEQKDTYRVANKIQPLEDGRLPIDNKYQINIKKEENGNYSLIVAEDKYIYAVSSTTTSGEGESQTTTTTYSVKEGEAAAGQGKWKANIEKGKVYFSWADEPSYGDFKFNPQSPRFKTYDPANTNLVSFSLYSTNIPLCRDLKFDHADRSSVVRGSSVTISCINAAKIFYSVGSGKDVTVEGNKASVIISDNCTITAYAENAAGVPTGDAISASYTVTDPYVEFAGYGSDGSIPDGEYIFVGKTDTNGDLRYMAEQATATASDGSIYRNAVKVTPFDDGRIGVSDNYAITVKKEEGANYSLITADGKYLYAESSTDPSGEGESQTTTTTYSVIGGDADQGQGQWTANVADNKVEFVWSDSDKGTLRFNSGASRFKTYVGSTGTKFYLYAPTPKPAMVVCTDATITNEEIHIAVNKTITFKSEGAGKMACQVLDSSNVETFDIDDGDTYTFTAASEPTEQIITIIPYDKYGAAYNPSKLVVSVHTHDVPTISYNLLEDVNKVKFIATNGEISEIRPYRIDGTLADAVSYANNTADIAFSNPRYKVSAKNTFGDTVEESFSFIDVLSEREGVKSPYSAYLVYKNATGTTYERNEAVFELDKAVDSFTYSMEGVLLKGNDLKNDYPFLLEDYTISLHVSWLRADSPIFLQAKDNTGSEAPARAKALDDIDAAVGIYDFVESGGAPLYFNSEGKNAINGSVVFVPFEYAQLKIDNIQDVVTAIGEILDEDDTEEVFYNLQGVRVENPDKGIYIRVKGNKTEKILK